MPVFSAKRPLSYGNTQHLGNRNITDFINNEEYKLTLQDPRGQSTTSAEQYLHYLSNMMGLGIT
jgi:hypothetical protein